MANGTNLNWHPAAAGTRSKGQCAQFSNPEAYFKTITKRQALIVNRYRASQKSVNTTKGNMESQQNPNEPGQPTAPGQQGGQEQDRERQERERQQREREKQGGGGQRGSGSQQGGR
jgi:hypothetical protein